MRYLDESRSFEPGHLAALPCWRDCGFLLGEHRWSDERGIVCPPWTARMARRLADALAAVSKLVAGQ